MMRALKSQIKNTASIINNQIDGELKLLLQLCIELNCKKTAQKFTIIFMLHIVLSLTVNFLKNIWSD